MPLTSTFICEEISMLEIARLLFKAPKSFELFVECLELRKLTKYVDIHTRYQNNLELTLTSTFSLKTAFIGETYYGINYNIVIHSLNLKTTPSKYKL